MFYNVGQGIASFPNFFFLAVLTAIFLDTFSVDQLGKKRNTS